MSGPLKKDTKIDGASDPAQSGGSRIADRPLLGIAILVIGASAAPVGDAISKFLGSELSVIQIVWARYVFALLAITPWLALHMGPREIARFVTPLEVLRGLTVVGMTFFYISAIQFMPLADALGLLFLYPLLATGLAVIFLGERVSMLLIGLSVLSLIGALLVIKPGFGELNLGMVFAILAATAISINIVISRKLAGRTPVFAGIAIATGIGTVVLSIFVPFVWVPPSLAQWGLLVLIGFTYVIVTWSIYTAFLYGKASVIAPFGYSEIIMATALGFYVFGDFPDVWAFSGIAIICCAGVVMAMHKR